jgi:copper resistance protein C
VLALLTGIGLGLLITAAPAAAHTVLLGADPADGASLTALPAAATLTFSDAIAQRDAKAAVATPGRAAVEVPATSSGPVVTVPLTDAGPGRYTITYRVVSADGHPVSGQVSFTVGTPEPSATPTSAPPVQPAAPGPGSSARALLAAAIALTGFVAIAAWAFARRRRPGRA